MRPLHKKDVAEDTEHKNGTIRPVSSDLTFAVVPSTRSTESVEPLLAQLASFLSRELGTPVRGITTPSYSDLVADFERDRIHFAWMSPLQLVLAQERISLRALATSMRSDRLEYCGVLFTESSNARRTLRELEGAKVAWVDPTSASGYLYPRLHLAARGIDPDEFFADELFCHSHREVVNAVFSGKVEVGATFAARPPSGAPVTRAGFCDVDPAAEAHIVEWTATIPNDLMVAHGLLSALLHTSFEQALFRLSESDDGRALLSGLFGAEKLVVPDPRPLGMLRQLVQQARENGLLLQL